MWGKREEAIHLPSPSLTAQKDNFSPSGCASPESMSSGSGSSHTTCSISSTTSFPAPPHPPFIQRRDTIEKELLLTFENLILQLFFQHESKFTKDMRFTEYEIIDMIGKVMPTSLSEERFKLAVAVVFTLQHMVEHKLLKKSKFSKSSSLFPHIFPITFYEKATIQKFIYETLCDHAVFAITQKDCESDLHFPMLYKHHFQLS